MNVSRPQTPSQTAGPFLHIGMIPSTNTLIQPLPPGEPITLHGTIFDAEAAPVTDALIEMWHPEAGWARSATDGEGAWQLAATRPATAPFVNLWIIARGINTPLQTRLYFPDTDWQSDPAMAHIPEARHATLVASQATTGAYRLDIRLGGEAETVFFDLKGEDT